MNQIIAYGSLRFIRQPRVPRLDPRTIRPVAAENGIFTLNGIVESITLDADGAELRTAKRENGHQTLLCLTLDKPAQLRGKGKRITLEPGFYFVLKAGER